MNEDELKHELASMRRAIRAILVVMFCGVAALCALNAIAAAVGVPRFSQIFDDMLSGGPPFPPLASFVMDNPGLFCAISAVCLLVSFGMIFLPRDKDGLRFYVLIAAAALQLIQFLVVCIGLSLPYIAITTHIGSP